MSGTPKYKFRVPETEKGAAEGGRQCYHRDALYRTQALLTRPRKFRFWVCVGMYISVQEWEGAVCVFYMPPGGPDSLKGKLQMTVTEKRLWRDSCCRRVWPLIEIPSGRLTYQHCQAPRYREAHRSPRYWPENFNHTLLSVAAVN